MGWLFWGFVFQTPMMHLYCSARVFDVYLNIDLAFEEYTERMLRNQTGLRLFHPFWVLSTLSYIYCGHASFQDAAEVQTQRQGC